MSVEIDQIIEGKYRITRLIGRGGMGAVYEGQNQRIDRRVAIKVLLPSEDQTAAVRFEQEARAAGRISNDHILEVLDVGSLPDGSQYMVTEFLDGEPLASRIEARGRLQATELAPMLVQLLSGLDAAHRAGIVHRDLKPDNIFLLHQKAGHADFVKIIDFGVSKFSQMSGDEFNMTKTGTMMGTPYYLSPEQARGQGGVDHRVDIYAVGVILYEALTGRVPFLAESFNDLLFKIVLEEAPPITDFVTDLDPGFALIVKKAMAKKLDERFASAAELRQAVEQWANERGVPLSLSVSGRASMASSASRRSNSSAPPAFAATAPRTAAHPTPGAFGTTGAAAPSEPLWAQRKVQIGAGAALVAIAAIAIAVIAGSGGDAPPAAVAEPAKSAEPELVPTVDPAFVEKPATAAAQVDQAPPVAPSKPEPAVSEPKADKQAAAPSAKTPAKTPATAAPAPEAPAAAPAAPAKPAKKKYYYGY